MHNENDVHRLQTRVAELERDMRLVQHHLRVLPAIIEEKVIDVLDEVET